MAKISTIDKERRFKKINRLIKKYHTGDRTMPEVIRMVSAQLNVCKTTVNNARNSGL